jgi:hypothetical protein
MYLRSEGGISLVFRSDDLRHIPGFLPGVSNIMRVKYSHKEFPIFHAYAGGPTWIPTVPNEYGRAGQQLSITITTLTSQCFVKNIHAFSIDNKSNLPWLSNMVTLRRIALEQQRLCLELHQEPAIEGNSNFQIVGETSGPLNFHLGTIGLRFDVRDAVGQHRQLSISHNGSQAPRLGIRHGHEFYKVQFVSFDGCRVRVVYRSRLDVYNVTTIYLRDPASLYRLSDSQPLRTHNLVGREWSEVPRVTLKRRLERSMLWHGGTYDAGRIGSEIAYVIGRKRLNLKGLVLPDPNSSGRDLFTMDGRTVIQSRMLTQTYSLNPSGLDRLLTNQVLRLMRKLREDFEFNPRARVGYAILSYLDSAAIRTRIVKAIP